MKYKVTTLLEYNSINNSLNQKKILSAFLKNIYSKQLIKLSIYKISDFVCYFIMKFFERLFFIIYFELVLENFSLQFFF